MKKYLFALLPALAFSAVANAQSMDGYYQTIQGKTLLTLNESAEKQAEQDRIKAVLRITREGREASAVQDFINKKMADAVVEAKKFADIKTSTGSYHVNPKWSATLKRNDGFEGSQELILDSANKESIFKVVQALQSNEFSVSSMNYYLSREKAASYRTELVNEALARVQSSAKSIADQLGAKYYHIGAVNVSGASSPRPVLARAMMMAEMADAKVASAPVIENSEETVSVNIDVTVVLDMQ